MTTEPAECPVYGQHKMYVNKTYEDYTLVRDGLYKRIEWAILYCNCGHVKRVEVQQ